MLKEKWKDEPDGCCGTCASFLSGMEDVWGFSWCVRLRESVQCCDTCPDYKAK